MADPGGVPSGFPMRFPVRVRFSDCDLMGHLNNAAYLTYFEEARIAYFRDMGVPIDLEGGFKGGLASVVAEARVRYRSPAYFAEELLVCVRVGEVRRTSYTFQYEVRAQRDGRLVAEGETVQVSFDYDKKKPVPVPEEWRLLAEQYEGRPLPTVARRRESEA